MKSGKLIIAALAALLLLAGCTTTFTAANGKLAYGDMAGTSKGEFSASAPAWYILHPSLISIQGTNKKLETVIDPALKAKGANAATNVKIIYGWDTLGYLGTYLTGGLVGFTHVEVAGTAISR